MDAINGIISTDVNSTVKSRMLVNVVRERGDILSATIEILTKNSDKELLALFLTEYDNPLSKRRKVIHASSASHWTCKKLEYFMISFRDTGSISDICSDYSLTPRARSFIEANRDLTRSLGVHVLRWTASINQRLCLWRLSRRRSSSYICYYT